MIKKIVLGGAFLLLLSGCGSTSGPMLSQDYQATESARIRLFGQNGKPSIMTVEAVDGRRIKVNVGGMAGDAFGSMLGMTKNHSIGMPATANTQNLSATNGLLSKAFYREFIVPAGKSVTVKNAFIGLSNVHHDRAAGVKAVAKQASCSSPEVTFTPMAGRDYEVATYGNGRVCEVAVFEVVTTKDGQAVLRPVLVQ